MQKFTIRLPDDTVERLNQTAEDRGLSFADVVREGLNLYLDRNSCILSENLSRILNLCDRAEVFFDRENIRSSSKQGGVNE